jgi:hypothetical protein
MDAGNDNWGRGPIQVMRDNPRIHGWIPLRTGPGGRVDVSEQFNKYAQWDWAWTPTAPGLRTRRYPVYPGEGGSIWQYALEMPDATTSTTAIQRWWHRGLRLMHGMEADVVQMYVQRSGETFDGWHLGYRTEIVLHADVLVVPVAIVSFRSSKVNYDFGPHAEALLDFLPSTFGGHLSSVPATGSAPAPDSIGLPPDDIWCECEHPIQFQSVGHWYVDLPEGWSNLNGCSDGYGQAWLPSFARDFDQQSNELPTLPEQLADAYADSPEELARLEAVFDLPKEDGDLKPLRPPVLRIGESPSLCPMAAGHATRDSEHTNDGVDLEATHAIDGYNGLYGNTVAHELGHVLGLEHVLTLGNLMQEKGDPAHDVALTGSQCKQAETYARYWMNAYHRWLADQGLVAPLVEE